MLYFFVVFGGDSITAQNFLAKVMPEDVVFESGVHHPSLTKKTRKIKKTQRPTRLVLVKPEE